MRMPTGGVELNEAHPEGHILIPDNLLDDDGEVRTEVHLVLCLSI